MRCRYVKIYEFVGAIIAIFFTQSHRIAGITEIHEINSFYGLAILYIKAWNNAFS